MTTQDKTELLYKKFLGTPAGNPGISYVGELGSARTNLFAQTQLFSQPIPQIAPESTDFIVSGYVTLVGGKTTIVQTEPSSGKLGTIKTSKSYPWLQKIEYLQLQQATPFSYYFNNPVSSINLLQNIIPFNYDLGGSYNYALYKSGSDPSTQASLLPSNPPYWFIDSDAGYLYFPTSSNDWKTYFSTLLPLISFYRYNGTMGIPTNLGNFAGAYAQDPTAIAIGNNAGYTGPGATALAIGNFAGVYGQGTGSIAIGYLAGPTGMSTNSIVLNASGKALAGTGPTGGFYVAPIASYSGSTGPFKMLAYGADNQIVTMEGTSSLNLPSSTPSLTYDSWLANIIDAPPAVSLNIDKTTTTEWTIKPATGGLADKEARQIAKLDLAANNRSARSNPRASYDITQLPTQYDGYTVVDNANSGGLVVGRPWTGIGIDDPANAAEPEATAWVLMDGPFYNTPGVPGSGFVGGQSWRKMAPIGYLPYGRETYTYGDETVRFDGTWLYENTTIGLIATGGTEGQWPWQASWTGSYKGTKITSTYVKTTNYPAVP